MYVLSVSLPSQMPYNLPLHVGRYVGWGCILNCFMLSSLPCFYAFCWSAIPTSCYIFNVFYSCNILCFKYKQLQQKTLGTAVCKRCVEYKCKTQLSNEIAQVSQKDKILKPPWSPKTAIALTPFTVLAHLQKCIKFLLICRTAILCIKLEFKFSYSFSIIYSSAIYLEDIQKPLIIMHRFQTTLHWPFCDLCSWL